MSYKQIAVCKYININFEEMFIRYYMRSNCIQQGKISNYMNLCNPYTNALVLISGFRNLFVVDSLPFHFQFCLHHHIRSSNRSII